MKLEYQNLVLSEFGKNAVEAIDQQIKLFGDGFVDVSRVLATTRKIMQFDKSEGLQCIFEALFYEPFYYDNFHDLKACIKKGGIDINRKNVERMLSVGVEVPTEIKELL